MKQALPQISFVMPTKNRGPIINKSIESIIQQTMPEWELIVVDDHSNSDDKTKDVAESFKDDRIRYVRMSDQRGGGIAEARNYGNMFAKAPIIAVADSDDLILPERARLTAETFKKEAWDVFYGVYDILDQSTGEIRERQKTPIVDYDYRILQEYNFIPHGSSAYRRELAYEYPYNSFFKIGEDYDFFTRLAKAGKKFYFCQEKIFRYILHGENITRGQRFENYEKLIKLNREWTGQNETSRGEIVSNIVGEE